MSYSDICADRCLGVSSKKSPVFGSMWYPSVCLRRCGGWLPLHLLLFGGAAVYARTTTAMNDTSTPPTPAVESFFFCYFGWFVDVPLIVAFLSRTKTVISDELCGIFEYVFCVEYCCYHIFVPEPEWRLYTMYYQRHSFETVIPKYQNADRKSFFFRRLSIRELS